MGLLGSSFRVGRLFGIDIRVHIFFVLWIGYILISSAAAGRAVGSQALFLGLLFGIVLLHEFGHCFGARAVGGQARNILMWPLGGLAYAHAPMRPWPQFVTVAAGPAVNVVLCLVSAAVMFAASGGRLLPGVNPLQPGFVVVAGGPVSLPVWLDYVFTFYHVNLFLLAFNLLPIYPLDGGQIFQAVIWPFVGLTRATTIACYVGLAGAVMLGVFGLRSGHTILLFIAIFGGMTCYQRLRMAEYGLLVEDDRFQPYDHGRSRRPGLWSRLRGRAGRPAPRERAEQRPAINPNPGGWEARQTEQGRLEAEVDRILRKVSEQGIHSLTYIERQTLERATRQRQQEERQFQRNTGV